MGAVSILTMNPAEKRAIELEAAERVSQHTAGRQIDDKERQALEADIRQNLRGGMQNETQIYGREHTLKALDEIVVKHVGTLENEGLVRQMTQVEISASEHNILQSMEQNGKAGDREYRNWVQRQNTGFPNQSPSNGSPSYVEAGHFDQLNQIKEEYLKKLIYAGTQEVHENEGFTIPTAVAKQPRVGQRLA